MQNVLIYCCETSQFDHFKTRTNQSGLKKRKEKEKTICYGWYSPITIFCLYRLEVKKAFKILWL